MEKNVYVNFGVHGPLTHTLSFHEIQHWQLDTLCMHNHCQLFWQLINRWSQHVQNRLSPAFD